MTAYLRLAAGLGKEKALLNGLHPPAAAPRADSTHQMAQEGLTQQRLFLDDCIVGFYLFVSHA